MPGSRSPGATRDLCRTSRTQQAGLTITGRHYIGYEADTGYYHYVIDTATHHHQRSHHVTTVCDTANHQIIDIVPSRDFVEIAHYLNNQSHQWKQGIKYATLDMSPTYRAVFNVILPNATQVADHFHVILPNATQVADHFHVILPNATQVADHFHVITLANRALDNVRRRVQQQHLGHRGRKKDPLYWICRLLISAEEKLDDPATERITAMLTLGDPGAEVAITYRVKECLREIYNTRDPQHADNM